MITLYTLNQSRSTRIAWLLEILGLDYQLKQFERDAKTKLAPLSLKQIHPLGKVPILQDGDMTIAESGAIVEYLINKYGKGCLRPQLGSESYPTYLQFLHYAEGSLMPFFILLLIFKRIESQSAPFFIKPIIKKIVNKVTEGYILPNLNTHLEYIEHTLNGRHWFTGELSGADIMMSFPLQAAVATGLAEKYSNICEYVQRIESDPNYLKATLRVGKLNLNKLM